MKIWVVLLRGVNVDGHKKLPTAAFRDLLTGLGYLDVATYIQSGNAVFRAAGTGAQISKKIQTAIQDQFGFEAEVIMLRGEQLQDAIAGNPYPQAADAPTTLHLFFLNEPPVAPDFEAMSAAATKADEFQFAGNVFYFHTPNGMGQSDLAGKLGRFIKSPMTGRNLRSCHKIADLVAAL